MTHEQEDERLPAGGPDFDRIPGGADPAGDVLDALRSPGHVCGAQADRAVSPPSDGDR